MNAAVFAAALALAAPEARAAERLSEDLARRIQRGIDAIYQMEFDACEKTFQDLLKDYPDMPQAHFGLATVSWARFEYEEEESNVARHKEFEERIEHAIAKGKQWVKAHPEDPEGLVTVSGMYGMRSRLAMMLHKWLWAYWDGTKAVKLTEQALRIDPHYYDVYTGLGMWDYYTDTLPNVIKLLARVVAIRGNARRGIERLNMAAEKGRFTSTAAKLILVELMQDRSGPKYDPALGLRMIREVRQKYPMNPLFHFVEVIYLFESKLAKEAVAEAQAMVRAIKEGRRFYQPRYLPRAQVGLASAYCLTGDWDNATRALNSAIDVLEREKGHNRWGLWALVRRGQIHDVQGKREAAVADYKRALKHLDYWDIHDFAKLHLKQPAVERDVLTAIPPP